MAIRTDLMKKVVAGGAGRGDRGLRGRIVARGARRVAGPGREPGSAGDGRAVRGGDGAGLDRLRGRLRPAARPAALPAAGRLRRRGRQRDRQPGHLRAAPGHEPLARPARHAGRRRRARLRAAGRVRPAPAARTAPPSSRPRCSVGTARRAESSSTTRRSRCSPGSDARREAVVCRVARRTTADSGR